MSEVKRVVKVYEAYLDTLWDALREILGSEGALRTSTSKDMNTSKRKIQRIRRRYLSG